MNRLELSTLPSRTLPAQWLLSPAAGISFGVAAYGSDLLSDPANRFITPVVSSGFGWGVAAFAVAYVAPTARSAVVGAISALAFAASTYYGLVVLFSDRWRHQDSASDLGWEQAESLFPVARAAGFWLVGALLGGMALGVLAHITRTGSTRTAGVACGLAFGMLAGEASYTIFHAFFIWVGPMSSFTWDRLQSASMQLAFALFFAIAVLRLRRAALLPTFLPVATASTLAGIAIWHVIQTVRTSL